MTGHPDYATVVFTYVPDEICVELKSMKLYLHGYRNEGIFFEAATNKIFQDLFKATDPRWARLETIWRGRGGIRSNVIIEDQKPDYDGPKPQFFSK